MKKEDLKYFMPAEWEYHEGTWLSWPHDKTNKGENYQAKLDPIWIAMTKALHEGENVHIVVYDETEKKHVTSVLENASVNMNRIDFLIQPTDDVWMRDNGPIFVRYQENKTIMTKWRFNGWGGRFPYEQDAMVPTSIAQNYPIPCIDVDICLEGGGIEVNGNGTFMAAKTSIINPNRNPGLSQKDIEKVLTTYLGVSNFIWITGINGEDNQDEVTDFHIDGAARFANETTILYEYDPDEQCPAYLLEAYATHYQELRDAKNIDQKPFHLIPVPVTKKNVAQAGCKGSYLNYYIGNKVVLVPIYGDVNDRLGLRIIEGQFPERKVIGINVCDLFGYGGMIHCVTQQQPK